DTSPDEAARAEQVEISKQGCFSVSAEGPTPGTEDGNDVAYAGVSCLDGSLVLLKVIRGHEALYLVRRGFSAPPNPPEGRAIDAYLADQVYLCPITGGIGRCARRLSLRPGRGSPSSRTSGAARSRSAPAPPHPRRRRSARA